MSFIPSPSTQKRLSIDGIDYVINANSIVDMSQPGFIIITQPGFGGTRIRIHREQVDIIPKPIQYPPKFPDFIPEGPLNPIRPFRPDMEPFINPRRSPGLDL